MTKITAAEVNALRKQTGSGMMDCKNALVEAEGDVEKAIELLRKQGQKVAAKRGDRDAAEGFVIAKTAENGKTGALIVLNCETDFVAKNDSFVEMANKICDIAISNNPASLDELKNLNYNGGSTSIGERLIEEIGRIGEKIELSTFERINSETVVAYNHPGNKIASLVGLNKDGETSLNAGRDVAMQVAAMAPVALSEDEVPADVVAKELKLGKEMAMEEGKPEELAEKIAKGKLNKFFKESTLLSQAFIKENKKSVAQYLNEQENELTITEFKRAALA